jgi:hypothetical protein
MQNTDTLPTHNNGPRYQAALDKHLDDTQEFDGHIVNLIESAFAAGWKAHVVESTPFTVEAVVPQVMDAINLEFQERFLDQKPVTLIQRTTNQWYNELSKRIPANAPPNSRVEIFPPIPGCIWMGRVFCELENRYPDRFRSKHSANGKIWRVTGKAAMANQQ